MHPSPFLDFQTYVSLILRGQSFEIDVLFNESNRSNLDPHHGILWVHMSCTPSFFLLGKCPTPLSVTIVPYVPRNVQRQISRSGASFECNLGTLISSKTRLAFSTLKILPMSWLICSPKTSFFYQPYVFSIEHMTVTKTQWCLVLNSFFSRTKEGENGLFPTINSSGNRF